MHLYITNDPDLTFLFEFQNMTLPNCDKASI